MKQPESFIYQQTSQVISKSSIHGSDQKQKKASNLIFYIFWKKSDKHFLWLEKMKLQEQIRIFLVSKTLHFLFVKTIVFVRPKDLWIFLFSVTKLMFYSLSTLSIENTNEALTTNSKMASSLSVLNASRICLTLFGAIHYNPASIKKN